MELQATRFNRYSQYGSLGRHGRNGSELDEHAAHGGPETQALGRARHPHGSNLLRIAWSAPQFPAGGGAPRAGRSSDTLTFNGGVEN
jgi:hypothetical protein